MEANINCEKVIAAVQKITISYNVSSGGYRECDRKNNVWKLLAIDFDCSGKQCRLVCSTLIYSPFFASICNHQGVKLPPLDISCYVVLHRVQKKM